MIDIEKDIDMILKENTFPIPIPITLRLKAFSLYKDNFRRIFLIRDILEILIKYYTSITLSTYLGHSSQKKDDLEYIRKKLEMPPLGNWLSLLKQFGSKNNATQTYKSENLLLKVFLDKSSRITNMRNDYAHGGVPSDEICTTDLENYYPLLKELIINNPFLKNDLILVGESKIPYLAMGDNLHPIINHQKFSSNRVYLKTDNEYLDLFPLIVYRPYKDGEELFFYNDYKPFRSVSLLNYEIAIPYRNDSIITGEIEKFFGSNKSYYDNYDQDTLNIIADRTNNFVGRNDELKEIQDFINNEESSFYFILGSPGMGKTSLVSKVFNKNEGTQSSIYPIFIRRGTFDDTSKIIYEIAKSLDKRIPHENISNRELSEKIKKSIEHFSNKGKKIIVLLDGIDEASDSSELIKYLPKTLPLNNIKIIISSRPNLALLEYYNTISTNKVKKSLDGLSKENIREILYEYVDKYQLSDAHIETIVKKSDYNPQYVHLLCRELEYESMTLDNLDKLPDEFFDLYRRRLKKVSQSEKAYKVLITVAMGKSIVNPEIISELTEITPFEISSLIEELQDLLVTKKVNKSINYYQLFHESLRDFLLAEYPDYSAEIKSKYLEFCRKYKNHPLDSTKYKYGISNYLKYLKDSNDFITIQLLALEEEFLRDLSKIEYGSMIMWDFFETAKESYNSNDMSYIYNLARMIIRMDSAIEMDIEEIIKKISNNEYSDVLRVLRNKPDYESQYARLLLFTMIKSPKSANSIYYDNIKELEQVINFPIEEKDFFNIFINKDCVVKKLFSPTIERINISLINDEILTWINEFDPDAENSMTDFKQLLDMLDKKISSHDTRSSEKFFCAMGKADNSLFSDILFLEERGIIQILIELFNFLLKLSQPSLVIKMINFTYNNFCALYSLLNADETHRNNIGLKIAFAGLINHSLIKNHPFSLLPNVISEEENEIAKDLLQNTDSFPHFIGSILFIQSYYSDKSGKYSYNLDAERLCKFWDWRIDESNNFFYALANLLNTFTQDSFIKIVVPQRDSVSLKIEKIKDIFFGKLEGKGRDSTYEIRTTTDVDESFYQQSLLIEIFLLNYFDLTRDNFDLLGKLNCTKLKVIEDQEFVGNYMSFFRFHNICEIKKKDNRIYDNTFLPILILNGKNQADEKLLDIIDQCYNINCNNKISQTVKAFTLGIVCTDEEIMDKLEVKINQLFNGYSMAYVFDFNGSAFDIGETENPRAIKASLVVDFWDHINNCIEGKEKKPFEFNYKNCIADIYGLCKEAKLEYVNKTYLLQVLKKGQINSLSSICYLSKLLSFPKDSVNSYSKILSNYLQNNSKKIVKNEIKKEKSKSKNTSHGFVDILKNPDAIISHSMIDQKIIDSIYYVLEIPSIIRYRIFQNYIPIEIEFKNVTLELNKISNLLAFDSTQENAKDEASYWEEYEMDDDGHIYPRQDKGYSESMSYEEIEEMEDIIGIDRNDVSIDKDAWYESINCITKIIKSIFDINTEPIFGYLSNYVEINDRMDDQEIFLRLTKDSRDMQSLVDTLNEYLFYHNTLNLDALKILFEKINKDIDHIKINSLPQDKINLLLNEFLFNNHLRDSIIEYIDNNPIYSNYRYEFNKQQDYEKESILEFFGNWKWFKTMYPAYEGNVIKLLERTLLGNHNNWRELLKRLVANSKLKSENGSLVRFITGRKFELDKLLEDDLFYKFNNEKPFISIQEYKIVSEINNEILRRRKSEFNYNDEHLIKLISTNYKDVLLDAMIQERISSKTNYIWKSLIEKKIDMNELLNDELYFVEVPDLFHQKTRYIRIDDKLKTEIQSKINYFINSDVMRKYFPPKMT